MPIYEYKCSTCGNKFEELRSLGKRDETAECPECNSKAERIVSCCAPPQASAGSSNSASCGSTGFS
ncbi:MAG: zinc ribbon domain-containing protein [candidate division Zixibacteria bacterium]|nr:zinc ribbon domain-containing protein [candidate division Zixibacteria bacterium]